MVWRELEQDYDQNVGQSEEGLIPHLETELCGGWLPGRSCNLQGKHAAGVAHREELLGERSQPGTPPFLFRLGRKQGGELRRMDLEGCAPGTDALWISPHLQREG